MAKRFIFICLMTIYCICLSGTEKHVFAEATVFTYRAPESENDHRYQYDTLLLQLALENTIETDGPYRLVKSPVMNYSRAHLYLETNALPNLILKLSYESKYKEKNMIYAPFPVDLGIVGYRVCFANPRVVNQLSHVNSFEELRKFSHGQGLGWSDTEILRHNGFKVTEVARYESLFKMVAKQRFDLFCRGANELLGELKTHNNIEGFSYDKSISIYYPLPRFFYMNSANKNGIDRISRGLKIAYEKGEVKKLWELEYKESIEFAELDKRKIFFLENPLIEDLSTDYQKYLYNPIPEN